MAVAESEPKEWYKARKRLHLSDELDLLRGTKSL